MMQAVETLSVLVLLGRQKLIEAVKLLLADPLTHYPLDLGFRFKVKVSAFRV